MRAQEQYVHVHVHASVHVYENVLTCRHRLRVHQELARVPHEVRRRQRDLARVDRARRQQRARVHAQPAQQHAPRRAHSLDPATATRPLLSHYSTLFTVYTLNRTVSHLSSISALLGHVTNTSTLYT